MLDKLLNAMLPKMLIATVYITETYLLATTVKLLIGIAN